MKTKHLITTLAFIAQALLGSTSFARAGAGAGDPATITEGGHSGNGGGLISRNGRMMTFYSAGFLTEPNEATTEEVPQLAQLIAFFNRTQVMSEATKVSYASNILPSPARNYYRVKEDSFTPAVRQRLIAEYGRVMKVDASQLGIAAITDTQSKTTYLFPEFYQLKPTEQMAILFHETYWILNPESTYNDVVKAEMSFQAYIESPKSPERLLRWLQTSGNAADVMTATIRTDLANGAMNGLVDRAGTTTMGQLLGDKATACLSTQSSDECVPFVLTHAYELTAKYPNSLFLKFFFQKLSLKKVVMGRVPESNFDALASNGLFSIMAYDSRDVLQSLGPDKVSLLTNSSRAAKFTFSYSHKCVTGYGHLFGETKYKTCSDDYDVNFAR